MWSRASKTVESIQPPTTATTTSTRTVASNNDNKSNDDDFAHDYERMKFNDKKQYIFCYDSTTKTLEYKVQLNSNDQLKIVIDHLSTSKSTINIKDEDVEKCIESMKLTGINATDIELFICHDKEFTIEKATLFLRLVSLLAKLKRFQIGFGPPTFYGYGSSDNSSDRSNDSSDDTNLELKCEKLVSIYNNILKCCSEMKYLQTLNTYFSQMGILRLDRDEEMKIQLPMPPPLSLNTQINADQQGDINYQDVVYFPSLTSFSMFQQKMSQTYFESFKKFLQRKGCDLKDLRISDHCFDQKYGYQLLDWISKYCCKLEKLNYSCYHIEYYKQDRKIKEKVNSICQILANNNKQLKYIDIHMQHDNSKLVETYLLNIFKSIQQSQLIQIIETIKIAFQKAWSMEEESAQYGMNKKQKIAQEKKNFVECEKLFDYLSKIVDQFESLEKLQLPYLTTIDMNGLCKFLNKLRCGDPHLPCFNSFLVTGVSLDDQLFVECLIKLLSTPHIMGGFKRLTLYQNFLNGVEYGSENYKKRSKLSKNKFMLAKQLCDVISNVNEMIDEYYINIYQFLSWNNKIPTTICNLMLEYLDISESRCYAFKTLENKNDNHNCDIVQLEIKLTKKENEYQWQEAKNNWNDIPRIALITSIQPWKMTRMEYLSPLIEVVEKYYQEKENNNSRANITKFITQSSGILDD